jgi:hypothetical protein
VKKLSLREIDKTESRDYSHSSFLRRFAFIRIIELPRDGNKEEETKLRRKKGANYKG